MKKLLLILLLFISYEGFCQDNPTYQRPPEEIAKLVEAPLTPFVSISPDKQWMLFLDRSDYPTIEQLIQTRIAHRWSSY